MGKGKGVGGVVFIEHPLYAKHCNRHFTSIISLTFQTAPFISSVTNKCLLIVYDTWGTVQGAEDTTGNKTDKLPVLTQLTF